MKILNKRRDGLKRQKEIMEIALTLFAQKGYHNTKLDEILTKAGIVKGTFYLHFNSKNDLLHMIVDYYLKELYNVIRILDISMDKPVDEIIGIYKIVARTLIQNEKIRLFARIMLTEAVNLDPKFSEKLNDFYNKIIQMSANYIKNAQNKKRISSELDALYVAICIVGSVKEIIYQWAVNEKINDLEKAILTTVDIYFKGLLQ